MAINCELKVSNFVNGILYLLNCRKCIDIIHEKSREASKAVARYTSTSDNWLIELERHLLVKKFQHSYEHVSKSFTKHHIVIFLGRINCLTFIQEISKFIYLEL